MLDLNRSFENADDDPMSGDNASCGVIFDRYREFSALARRLEADETSLGMEMHSQELEALWERRSQLARELVDTPAPAIADVVFKMTLVSSLVAEGEVRLGLTQQCVEECERALPVETVGEQGFMALEPALWSSCQQILQRLVAAAAEDFEDEEFEGALEVVGFRHGYLDIYCRCLGNACQGRSPVVGHFFRPGEHNVPTTRDAAGQRPAPRFWRG